MHRWIVNRWIIYCEIAQNNITEPILKHVMEEGKYYLALNSINI